MATMNELAYDLLTTVRPQLSDDNDISLEQIKFWIHNQRSLLIRQDLNKGRPIDDDIAQVICMDTELVDSSDCCGVDLGCKIVRTVEQIPSTIGLHYWDSIVRIGPVNTTQKPYSYIDYERVPYIGSGRFTSNEVYTFVHNGYVHLFSHNSAYKATKKLVVKAVFENPTDAAQFTSCSTGNVCYSDDDYYPIKTWMIPAMKEMILKSNLLIAVNAETISDKSNNADSNPIPVK